MIELTDEQFKKLFGEYKGSIVIEHDANAETTQEPRNDLAKLTINLIPMNQLIDIGNIPMLE